MATTEPRCAICGGAIHAISHALPLPGGLAHSRCFHAAVATLYHRDCSGLTGCEIRERLRRGDGPDATQGAGDGE